MHHCRLIYTQHVLAHDILDCMCVSLKGHPQGSWVSICLLLNTDLFDIKQRLLRWFWTLRTCIWCTYHRIRWDAYLREWLCTHLNYNVWPYCILNLYINICTKVLSDEFYCILKLLSKHQLIRVILCWIAYSIVYFCMTFKKNKSFTEAYHSIQHTDTPISHQLHVLLVHSNMTCCYIHIPKMHYHLCTARCTFSNVYYRGIHVIDLHDMAPH